MVIRFTRFPSKLLKLVIKKSIFKDEVFFTRFNTIKCRKTRKDKILFHNTLYWRIGCVKNWFKTKKSRYFRSPNK
eukprot:23497_5